MGDVIPLKVLGDTWEIDPEIKSEMTADMVL
jgi:hypothetical protein